MSNSVGLPSQVHVNSGS